jgi:hypothetical protein
MPAAGIRLRSLETARECASLGACPRTIGWLTGLSSTMIREQVFDAAHRARRGRPPYTEDFIFRASSHIRSQLGCFAAQYERLSMAGFGPAACLIAAYRHYLSFSPGPAFSFDQAFFLVSSLAGIWACRQSTLELARCPRCMACLLVARGTLHAPACAFCRDRAQPREVTRAVVGRLVRDAEPLEVSAKLTQRLDALHLMRMFESLGAHARVVRALLHRHSKRARSLPCERVHLGKALPLAHWTLGVRTPTRAQYSVLAATFTRLLAYGVAPEAALAAAYRHTIDAFAPEPVPRFDRCFEVASLVTAQWGIAAPALCLTTCPRCRSAHLVSVTDRATVRCPFCVLLRRSPVRGTVQGLPRPLSVAPRAPALRPSAGVSGRIPA